MPSSHMSLFLRRHAKEDGRELLLYGRSPHEGKAVAESDVARPASPPHLRWHPLRREWVGYAGARQDRTFLPQAADCPLCPARERGAVEIPFRDFEIAVFENRFPALVAEAPHPAGIAGAEAAPARGRCEVVVYSADHAASLGNLTDERLDLLVDVWGARIEALTGMGFDAVLPFENRGEEIGVTLHHPHGQIYAFGFVPAQMRRAAEAQAASPVIASLVAETGRDLFLREGDEAVSFVPPFAMYPYEIWLAPRRRVAGPHLLTAGERAELAHGLGDAVRRLDALFGTPMPYILTVQTAPRGFEESFHMTIELKPFRRDAGKLKYLAGVEQGSGVFLVDVAPEAAAARLKSVLP